MTRDEAAKLVEKHGSQAKAGQAAGVSARSIRRALARGAASPHPIPTQAKKAGRSLSEFRSLYDKDFIVPNRIKAALKILGGGWEYESQFARMAEVSLADLGNYRDQFADHVITLRESRRAWAGTVATAKAMREMV
jgi:hypothetical protein